MTRNLLPVGQGPLDPRGAIRYPEQGTKRAKNDQGDPLIIAGHKKEIAQTPQAD